MSNIIDTTARTASTIAAEIRMIEEQAARILIHSAIQIGQRLVEAKSMVEDGKWLEYIKTELNYEKSTAQNYMRLYKEYGSDQSSMFDTFAQSETFRRLTTTKALALLQVPREDREAFAAENNIENMSTRELQQAIRERDAAISAKNAAIVTKNAAIDARDESEKEADRLRSTVKSNKEQIAKLEVDVREAETKLKSGAEEVEKLRGQLREARKNESDAKIALKKARENPEIPENVMDQLRKEAEAEALAQATKEAEQKLEAVAKEQESIREQLRKAEEQLEVTKKEAKLQNPDAAVFKALFEQVQQDFNRLHGTLKKLRLNDPELGAKLTNATVALLDKLKSDMAE